MRQRLALIAIEQNDVAGFGLLFAQLQAQADPLDLGSDLAPFQRVSRPPPAELFLRSALDSCERLIGHLHAPRSRRAGGEWSSWAGRRPAPPATA